ncbi:PREDICTED: syncytin-1-like [Myotis brandtii]|uniref:syncytin-1-like n=1 Tax=Myotis brandtii TaxID=109478 RepID=UPI00070434BE|nr:PREDICTED: syncytin-1-like [Myotis brandtii]XP_014406001.1 PREDICTED: syncytin-1-like [Myotis brandtii]XP_014406002.1 PREDICTED: syncytin-1-like [Myotis brandtii]XP_014406003.1 PREDICTED: syncytin-1-like [Myotis brandtii]XP_014406004.1 PREDICTED: syncytin-1-like [Myotis brandtii]XP_014406005.1 PREDICTED: syncytin-1-like [Myotis brandtii]
MADQPDRRPTQGQVNPGGERIITLLLLLATLPHPSESGLGPPPNAQDLVRALYGSPCDCTGGSTGVTPSQYSQTTDCGSRTAYLTFETLKGDGFKQGWKCVSKPKIILPVKGKPGPCPSDCQMATEMHSTCYREVQHCTHTDGKVYLTAILQRTYSGSFGGDWDTSSSQGYSKLAQASCRGNLGQASCWSPRAPVHVSDGGGPTDRVREAEVQEQIEQMIHSLYPPLRKPRDIDLDAQTSDILEATLRALNGSNPSLAADCWLCMTLGTAMPLALPAGNSSIQEAGSCSLTLPFRIQPVGFSTSPCFRGLFQNNSYDLDVGYQTFSECTQVSNHSTPLCPAPGQVFVCGGSLAFTALPVNWTGLCIQAIILPDIDIIPGEEPVPLPSLDYIAGRSKRAIQFIPLLLGLGVSGAVASGSAGLGVAVHSYTKLSNQLIDDVPALSGTINDPQDQIDSLAEVVLQNRRGLDLLTAEQRGICLALQERCCFYANKSGIVRDKIKKLQEDLVKRRKELVDNPLWSSFNGLLPYLLPLLGPLLGLVLMLTIAPCIFRSIANMIQARTQDLKIPALRVQYQNVAIDKESESESKV